MRIEIKELQRERDEVRRKLNENSDLKEQVRKL